MHFDTKANRLERLERSALLQKIKAELGVKEDYVEVLA